MTTTESHVAEIDEGPNGEGPFIVRCQTCRFESAKQDNLMDAIVIGERHTEIGGCER